GPTLSACEEAAVWKSLDLVSERGQHVAPVRSLRRWRELRELLPSRRGGQPIAEKMLGSQAADDNARDPFSIEALELFGDVPDGLEAGQAGRVRDQLTQALCADGAY